MSRQHSETHKGSHLFGHEQHPSVCPQPDHVALAQLCSNMAACPPSYRWADVVLFLGPRVAVNEGGNCRNMQLCWFPRAHCQWAQCESSRESRGPSLELCYRETHHAHCARDAAMSKVGKLLTSFIQTCCQ
jgi:hypothetical protein